MNISTLQTTLAALCVLAGVTLAAVGCASTSRFDGPDGDRRLYEARCGFCHVPFAPSDFHPDDWPALVGEMSARAGLSPSYRERVTRFVVSASREAWDKR